MTQDARPDARRGDGRDDAASGDLRSGAARRDAARGRVPGESLVWAALAAATLCKLYLALTTEGTIDVAGFADFARKGSALGGLGLYHDPGEYSPYVYLPFHIHLLRALDWLGAATPLPFAFWLRLPAILADAGSFLIVRDYFERRPELPGRLLSLLLLALSPVSLLVSGFHGNTDPLLIFLALLALRLVETRRGADDLRRTALAGVAFGMAVNLKIVPLVFAPAILFYLGGTRARVRFFGAAAAAVFLASLPYVLQEPLTIARAVFGYGSLYGSWGWSYLLAAALPETLRFARPPHGLYGPHAAYAAAAKGFAFASILAASVWMNLPRGRTKRTRTGETRREADEARTELNEARREAGESREESDDARPSLVAQCGLVMSIFLTLTPGFGTQYLAWIVPFVAARGPLASVVFNTAAGYFLVVSYLCWFYRPQPAFCSTYDYGALMLAAWLSVILVLFLHLGHVRRRTRRAATQTPP